jgi:hypothetical protein
MAEQLRGHGLTVHAGALKRLPSDSSYDAAWCTCECGWRSGSFAISPRDAYSERPQERAVEQARDHLTGVILAALVEYAAHKLDCAAVRLKTPWPSVTAACTCRLDEWREVLGLPPLGEASDPVEAEEQALGHFAAERTPG